ncbi:hypothetical protein L6R50_13825 [Myxococcota bacterium]|nr:hypothetical protein [Myxococcota bacterium]
MSGRPPHAVSPELRAFLLAAIPSLLLFLTYCDVTVNASDEGAWISAAWVLRQGRDPFLDYLFPHPSVMPWVYAALFDLFGESVLVVRVFWAVVRACAAGFATLAARALLPGRPLLAAFPAVALALAGGPWHKTHVGLGLAVGCWLLLRFLARPSPGRGLALGASQGLVACLDLPNNVFGLPGTAAALFLAVASRPRGDRTAAGLGLGAWIAGLALGLAPLAAAMAPRLGAFVLATGSGDPVPIDPFEIARASWIGWPGVAATLASGPDPSRLVGAMYLDGMALLPFAAAAVGARGLKAAAGRGEAREAYLGEARARLALAAVAAGLVVKVAVRADAPHMFQNAIPFSLLLCALCADGARALAGAHRPRRAAALAAGALAAAAAGLLAFTATYPDPYYAGSVTVLAQAESRVGLRRVPLRDRARVARDLERLDAFLRMNVPPGAPVFAGPTCPLVHFMSERPNATRLIWYTPPKGGSEKGTSAALVELDRVRPDWVVWNIGPPPHGELAHFEARAPELVAYLRRHFERVTLVGPYEVRRRVPVPSSPPSRPPAAAP